MAGKLTIYRKCKCGETAHDYAGLRDANGKMVYVCRNCRRERTSADARSLRLEGK